MQQNNPDNIIRAEGIVQELTDDLSLALNNIKLSETGVFSSFDEYLSELEEHLPRPDTLRTILLANRERNLQDGALPYEIKVFGAADYAEQYKDLAEYCDSVMKVDNPDRSQRIMVVSFLKGMYHVCPILIHLKNKKIDITLVESISADDQVEEMQKSFIKNLGSSKGCVELVTLLPLEYTIQAGGFECGAYTAYTIDILSKKTDSEIEDMRNKIQACYDSGGIDAPSEIIRAAQSKTTIDRYITQIVAQNVTGRHEIQKDIEDAFTNLSRTVTYNEGQAQKQKPINAYIWYAASQYFDAAITYAESVSPDALISRLDRMSKGDPDKNASTSEPAAKRHKIEFGR